MGKKKEILKIALFLLITLTNCVENQNVQKEYEKISVIVLTISKGGREIDYTPGKQTVIPDDLKDEVFSFKLDSVGKLITYYGFGKCSFRDIHMNLVDKKDSVYLVQEDIDNIFSIAKKININSPYKTERRPTDSWLIKLRINKNESIFYSGENNIGSSQIHKDYLEIVRKITDLSAIKVKYQRTTG